MIRGIIEPIELEFGKVVKKNLQRILKGFASPILGVIRQGFTLAIAWKTAMVSNVLMQHYQPDILNTMTAYLMKIMWHGNSFVCQKCSVCSGPMERFSITINGAYKMGCCRTDQILFPGSRHVKSLSGLTSSINFNLGVSAG